MRDDLTRRIARWSPMSPSGWFQRVRTKPDRDIGLHLPKHSLTKRTRRHASGLEAECRGDFPRTRFTRKNRAVRTRPTVHGIGRDDHLVVIRDVPDVELHAERIPSA